MILGYLYCIGLAAYGLYTMYTTSARTSSDGRQTVGERPQGKAALTHHIYDIEVTR